MKESHYIKVTFSGVFEDEKTGFKCQDEIDLESFSSTYEKLMSCIKESIQELFIDYPSYKTDHEHIFYLKIVEGKITSLTHCGNNFSEFLDNNLNDVIYVNDVVTCEVLNFVEHLKKEIGHE